MHIIGKLNSLLPHDILITSPAAVVQRAEGRLTGNRAKLIGVLTMKFGSLIPNRAGRFAFKNLKRNLDALLTHKFDRLGLNLLFTFLVRNY